MRLRDERGLILPLAVLLVILLMVSGMTFMQQDYLERRMATNEWDNHGAFFFANAGLERARENLKLPETATWTPILDGSTAGYPADATPADTCLDPAVPDSCLCPDPARGCVILPFQTVALNPDPDFIVDGDPITDPGTPIDGVIFEDTPEEWVWYNVRAFNNNGPGDAGTTDGDQTLTIRALGRVRGEDKLLELSVFPVSGLKLINCQGDPDEECPDRAVGNPDKYIQPSEGREPASFPQLPTMPALIDPTDPSACNPANFYCDDSNFNDPAQAPYVTNVITLSGGMTLSDQPTSGSNVQIENNTFYLVQGDVLILDSQGKHDVIVYSLGRAELQSPYVIITNTIVVGATGVRLNGNLRINEPVAPATYPATLPYPTLISGGDIIQASSSIEVWGHIYSTGTIDLNPIDVHGVLIGNRVETQGGQGTLFTDDGTMAYYAFMPGFDYPDELLTTTGVAGTWREIE